MGRAVGIDLGTTNSEVAIVENGQPRVLPGTDGDLILPSCVGFDEVGNLLIGRDAIRQYAAAPERTIKSIKRLMGTDQKVKLGDQDYLPQEISAIILRALKQRAEVALNEEVTQAVITVPAYFTDAQRRATKEAGEIAGLEVLRILNEPTAAALTYNIGSDETERVLVYDLGGGTFDVSIVEITGDITEVLASHGNNHLGGDDFDNRLRLYLAELYQNEHGIPVPDDLQVTARLIRAAEDAKIKLSDYGFISIREAFLGSKGKTALHLETELSREALEELLRPMLTETLDAIDRALEDAKLTTEDIDRVILVGGSTRIPLIHRMVEEHLGQAPVDGVQPDLCVALGAALQAGVLTGEDVDAILVDVIPHSLGIAAAISTEMGPMPGFFSVIIPRNSVVPISRSQIYSTLYDGQEQVQIEVFQGENPIAEENVPLGSMDIEGLPARPAGGVKIEVHFDFDPNGILTITATEKGKGQQGSLVVNSSGTSRLSSHDLTQAREGIEQLFNLEEILVKATNVEEDDEDDESSELEPSLAELIANAEAAMANLDADQSEELKTLLDELKAAIADDNSDQIFTTQQAIEDLLYYAEGED